MFNIEESDFQSLDSFPLKWRWNNPRWNNLSADVLAQIQPLSPVKAHQLNQFSLRFCYQSGLVEDFFDDITCLDTSNEDAETKGWLLNCNSDGQIRSLSRGMKNWRCWLTGKYSVSIGMISAILRRMM